MTSQNSTAISLPPGSFELSDLDKLGQRAVKASDADHAKLVDDGLAAINQRIDRLDLPGRLPGHKFVEVERVLAEGTEEPVEGGKKGETEMVGEIRVTENIQVFDRALADEEREAAEAPPVSGGAAGPSAEARGTAASESAAAGAGAGA